MEVKNEPDDQEYNEEGHPPDDGWYHVPSVKPEALETFEGANFLIKSEFQPDIGKPTSKEEVRGINCEVSENGEESTYFASKVKNRGASHRIKSEFQTDIGQPIFKEEVALRECKFETTGVKSTARTELLSTNLPWDQSQAKAHIHEQYIITEILQQKMVAIIIVANAVFNEQNFVCRICDDIFPSSNMLKQHAIRHSDGGKSKKTDIKIEPEHESPSSSYQDSVGSETHQNNMNDICNEDHSIDIKHEPLEVHPKIIEQEKHDQSKKPNIKLHSREKTFKCDQCSYSTAVGSNLKTHKMSHSGEKLFKCDQCSYKATRSCYLKTHKMSHTGEKPFKCDQCSYTTTWSSGLRRHKRSHTGEKPFKCDQCSFRTAESSHFKTHKMSHTGEKPFKCDQCSYKTAESSSLKTHKMSHTGEKPFKCDQCSYRTAVASNLKTHKMSHSGEKPFKCDQCSYRTVYSRNFKIHKMSHTGEKPFKCDQCSHRSAQSGNLKKHKMSHT